MAIDLVINRHKAIQNMSLDNMAKYFVNELRVCCKEKANIQGYSGNPCYIGKSCTQCWKEFLQGSDN